MPANYIDFGNGDPYVYHLTGVPAKKFKRLGIMPSKDGYSGPGVYMANTPEATQYYHELEDSGSNLMRISKQDLVDTFGKYSRETPEGIEFDDDTGEVFLSGSRSVPPEMIQSRLPDGSWKSVTQFMPTDAKEAQSDSTKPLAGVNLPNMETVMPGIRVGLRDVPSARIATPNFMPSGDNASVLRDAKYLGRKKDRVELNRIVRLFPHMAEDLRKAYAEGEKLGFEPQQ